MKKLFILIMLVLIPSLSFAQTKSSAIKATPKPSIEVVLNQQVEILNARIDSMTIVHNSIVVENTRYIDSMSIAHQQAIETVKNEQRELYVNYYNQLDSHLDRWLIILSLIWGAIGVAFGALAPFFLNKESEKRVEKKIDEFKTSVKNTTDDLKQLLQSSLHNNAKAQNSRNRVFSEMLSKKMNEQLEYFANSEKEQKEYVNRIKDEVSTYLTQSKIQSLLSKAQNCFKKNPEQAIKLYTDILDIEPTNEDALLWRGIAYCNLRESKKALEDLNKLVKIYPRNARAYNNIANVYANEKQYSLALRKYNTALKINPQYAAVYSNIAILYTEQEKYQIALEYCDKALKIDDEMIKTHKQKISIYAKLAKLSDEEETRQKYIDKIKQEHVFVNMLKDKYLSELMSS